MWAVRIARSERGAEQSTSSCARLRQRAEALSTSTDALLGFTNDPGPGPDRGRPGSVVRGAGVTRSLHTASLAERRSMRMRALLGSLALALLLLGYSHAPPAALPGAVPCVSVTLVEACELADFTRIRTDHTAMR